MICGLMNVYRTIKGQALIIRGGRLELILAGHLEQRLIKK